MYDKYRDFQFKDPDDPEAPGIYRFRPKTQFNELNQEGSTAALMSHPMMMRIILSAYHRKPLPDQLHYDDVMKLYMEDVVEEKNSTSGSFPERRAFLRNLVREMDKQESDSIARDDLYTVPALVPAMSNPQKDSPYVQLLDLGVILEEWDGDDCYVRFCFDRLLEFMLAEMLEKQVKSDNDIVRLEERVLRLCLVLRQPLSFAQEPSVFEQVHSQVLKELETYPLEQLVEEVEPMMLKDLAQVAGFAGSGELIRPLGYYLRRHSQCLTNRERDPYQSSF